MDPWHLVGRLALGQDVELVRKSSPIESISKRNFKIVAEEIGSAMASLGVCCLINHGVSNTKVEEVHKASKEFFTLPTEIKAKYRKRFPKKDFQGYAGPGDEVLNEEEKNSTELREIFDISKGSWRDKTPYFVKEVPGFNLAFENISKDLDGISKKLLRCLEIYFGFEENFLIKRHRNIGDESVKSQTVSRSLYYYTLNPDADIPPNAIRCGEHKDWGTITLLFQDMIGGLEVETLDGQWIAAVPIKNSIIVNTGLLLEVYTSGQLMAAKHRVRIITEGGHDTMRNPRQSFIHCVNPDGVEDVYPVLPIMPGKENFAKLEPVNAFEFFLHRMDKAGTY